MHNSRSSYTPPNMGDFERARIPSLANQTAAPWTNGTLRKGPPAMHFAGSGTTGSLEYVVRPYGGRQGMIDLARHCRRDRRIRRLVQRWDETAVGKRTQRSLAEWCRRFALDEAEFLAIVISRLWAVGVDVTPLIKRCAACRVTTDPLMGV